MEKIRNQDRYHENRSEKSDKKILWYLHHDSRTLNFICYRGYKTKLHIATNEQKI